MRRWAILLYGIACYLVFFGTFLYAVGFLANAFVPKSIDSGAPGPLVVALLVDLALLALFAVQHSVMARQGFKRWITRFIPAAAERSTYVLASSLALIVLFVAWQPIPGTVWSVDHPVARALVVALFLGGVVLVLVSTFLIDHFDLFGLRQAFLAFRGRPYEERPLATPLPYRLVRHPLYVGWLVTFWAAPTMTLARLVFALATTAYILVAIRFEERDLVALHGERYERYRRQVPMLLPWPRRAAREAAAHEA